MNRMSYLALNDFFELQILVGLMLAYFSFLTYCGISHLLGLIQLTFGVFWLLLGAYLASYFNDMYWNCR